MYHLLLSWQVEHHACIGGDFGFHLNSIQVCTIAYPWLFIFTELDNQKEPPNVLETY